MDIQTISNVPKLTHNDDKNMIADTEMLTLLKCFRYVTNMASVEDVTCPSLGFLSQTSRCEHTLFTSTLKILLIWDNVRQETFV